MNTETNVKFGNQAHPAVKDLQKMNIRKIVRIAHYFGMAIVPEPVIKKAIDGIDRIKAKAMMWGVLERQVRTFLDTTNPDVKEAAMKGMRTSLRFLTNVSKPVRAKRSKKKVRLKRKKIR